MPWMLHPGLQLQGPRIVPGGRFSHELGAGLGRSNTQGVRGAFLLIKGGRVTGRPLFLKPGARVLNVPGFRVLLPGHQRDPMPGSSGADIRTLRPGSPAPQQSVSRLALEELAEIGKLCPFAVSSREKDSTDAHLFVFLTGKILRWLKET